MESGRPCSRLLRRLEQLNNLSSEDRQRIAELPLTVINVGSNHQVARPGDIPSRCTLVLGGFVCSSKLVNGARRQITSFFVPGDIPDLHTLQMPSFDHGLSALGPAVLALLPHSALSRVLHVSPRLGQAFWRESLVQAGIYREWIANLGRRDAVTRVAHVLCELTLRLQAVDLARDFCFPIPWTQMDLADACGISNVHANRVVQELRRLGLVEWATRQIRIRNWDALVRLADFSDEYLQLPTASKDSLTTSKDITLAPTTPAEPGHFY
jgi:CRP-like cAMP-binding protein